VGWLRAAGRGEERADITESDRENEDQLFCDEGSGSTGIDAEIGLAQRGILKRDIIN